jgi:glycosyltransferase involved in cell wall biosynthesis
MAELERRILIAHYRPDIVSGAENSIADFVDQVSPRFQVTMLVPGEGILAEFYRRRGFSVWVRKVETPRRLKPGLHQVQSYLFARALHANKFDAVLCNTFPSASRVGTASQMAGIPHAIYLRDYTPDLPVHRRLMARANALYAISKDVIAHHAAMAHPSRFYLTYNYINPEPVLARAAAHAASGKRLLPFPPDNPVIGLVGRITPYKQPDLFLKAIPRVLQEIPTARFVLVGAAQSREAQYQQSLHRLARDLGIADHVAFLGQRRDAVELTTEFSIACLASGREPLGRVVLEAHLLGIPVLVPDTGGPAEIVQNGLSGLTFSSTAPDAQIQLASGLVRLLKDPALRSCLAEAGRKHIAATFASHTHIHIQEELIEQLCQQRP